MAIQCKWNAAWHEKDLMFMEQKDGKLTIGLQNEARFSI